jgi:hypothetical protein
MGLTFLNILISYYYLIKTKLYIMEANKIRIIVTTEGRLFFIEDEPNVLGFMYSGESIKKRFFNILPNELIDFFEYSSKESGLNIVNLFKNAFVGWIDKKLKRMLNGKFHRESNLKFNNITCDIIKKKLSSFDKKLYAKLMHIVLNLAGSIAKIFRNDFRKLRSLK